MPNYRFKEKNDVKLLTGKYKGRRGYVVGPTEKAKGSSQNRYQIKLQTGRGWVTLLINENNLKLKAEVYCR